MDMIMAKLIIWLLQSGTELTGTISPSFQRPLGNRPRLLVASAAMAPLPPRSFRRC